MVQRLDQILNPPEFETPVPFILYIETCTISKLHMLHITKCVIACQKKSFQSGFGCFQMLTSAIQKPSRIRNPCCETKKSSEMIASDPLQWIVEQTLTW
jgi:hypothetical protein